MTKRTFLKKLKDKLEVLEKAEIDDIIKEYSDHISAKVKEGKTEKEAVADFGDIDELVSEILTAYKVRGREEGNNFEKFITNLFDDIGDFFSKFTETIENQDSSKLIITVIYFIFGILFLSVILWFIKLPFLMFRNVVIETLDLMGNGVLATSLESLIIFIFDITLIIFSFLIIVIFIKKAMNYFYKNEEKIDKKAKEIKPIIKEKKQETKKIIEKKDEDSVFGVFIILLKIFVVFAFFIPLLMSALGLVIALGVVLFFLIQGVTSYGLLLILIGSILITFGMLDIIWKFLTTKGGVK